MRGKKSNTERIKQDAEQRTERVEFSKSSNLKSAEWEKPIQGWGLGVLTVEFVSGAVWKYTGVPYEVFHELAIAEETGGSAGKIFSAKVRGKYPEEKVRDGTSPIKVKPPAVKVVENPGKAGGESGGESGVEAGTEVGWVISTREIASIPLLVTLGNIKARHDACKLTIQAIEESVPKSGVICTDRDFESYGAKLAVIAEARGNWTQAMEPLVRPVYNVLQGLYGVRKAMDDQFKDLETRIKSQMKSWTEFKLQQKREAEARYQEERRKLEMQAEQERQKALEASTKKARVSAEIKAQYAEQQIAIRDMTPAPSLPSSSGSSTRISKKVVLTSKDELLREYQFGNLPSSVFEVNMQELQRLYKECPDRFDDLMGVEVVDDVVIAKRGSR